ncbi:siderophore-interacting protein [Tabrizicola sp. J26]|uniref:siderophore-interacting protein n=1 Tax=Alitabrizicola rongguiensis TaxID=2909234 RepID=UPI001F23BA36|nr:siderophore-interacting protein [Tabrizicola rongguiensis]MCF1709426.1 siderophore-interacting protein [Tabrizicola rongguiensis]
MDQSSKTPLLTRLRHETRRRELSIISSRRVTPNMLRLRLGGPELADFVSASPADHVKLFVPDGTGGKVMRDYTPRRHDPEESWLEIDFALHDAGPATLWALQARPGDRAEIGGPRGSLVIGGPVASWVLIGDETALPSIARRIEELPPGATVTSIVAVSDIADQQVVETKADHEPIWVHRKDPADATALATALEAVALPPQTFVWIAAEAGVARALRDAVLARGVPPEWLRAAGYWVVGEADASVKDL